MGADNLLKFPNTHDEKGVTGWLKDVILYSNKKKKNTLFFPWMFSTFSTADETLARSLREAVAAY